MTQIDPVTRYGELKTQIKLLENELSFLAPEVLKQISILAGDTKAPVDTPLGTFVLAQRKIWSFSEAVAELEVKVTDTKDREKADGTATFEVKEDLRFNVKV